MENKCPLCQQKEYIQNTSKKSYSDFHIILECPLCGTIHIDTDYLRYLQKNPDTEAENRHIFSAYYRECKNLNIKPITLDSENTDKILTSHLIPDKNDIRAKALKLLQELRRNSKNIGDTIRLCPDEWTTAIYAKEWNEMIFILNYCIDKEYIYGSKQKPNDTINISDYILAPLGYEYLAGTNTISKNIFVAMEYSDEMFKIFNSIKKSVKDKTGFDLFIIADKEHNNDITDEIIAEINRSRAIIADFSHNNNGAYYEAGYAHGLGKEVIFTCKSDKIKDVHFDTSHRNHILWANEKDLEKSLTNRINATLNKTS